MIISKNTLRGAITAMALAAVVLAPGCSKDDSSELSRIDDLTAEIQAGIATLETFKSWAETNGDGFQAQIEALETALAEARSMIEEVGDADELARRIDELVAGSTLTIAQIQSRLGAQSASIEELRTLLGALDGAGELIALLGRIAILEQADKDILDRLNRLGTSTGSGTGGGPANTGAIEAALDEIRDLLLARIGSIDVLVDDRADGLLTVTGVFDNNGTSDPSDDRYMLNPLDVTYVLSRPDAVWAVYDAWSADPDGALSGYVNRVETRALEPLRAHATLSGYNDHTYTVGTITIRYNIDELDWTEVVAGGDQLQLALRIETASGSEIVSDFATLALDLTPGSIVDGTGLAITGILNDGMWVRTSADDGYITNEDDWFEAELTSAPTVNDSAEDDTDGILSFPATGNLELDFVISDPDWAVLINPRLSFAPQLGYYVWDGTDWVEENTGETLVRVETNVVDGSRSILFPDAPSPGGDPVRVRITLTIEADNLATGRINTEFAVDVRRRPTGIVVNVFDHITDPHFYDYAHSALLPGGDPWDSDADGILTEAEAAAVEIINFPSLTVDAAGIEYFTGLKELHIIDNPGLTSLDLEHNTALEILVCPMPGLVTLDLEHNTALRELDCTGTLLTSLDLEHNTALETLKCGYNDLSVAGLDVSYNPGLKYLDCSDNGLSSLDVSNNSVLETLICAGNVLAGIDISQNPALVIFDCGYNPGNGMSNFPVTATFSGTPPIDFSTDWEWNGQTITAVYSIP